MYQRPESSRAAFESLQTLVPLEAPLEQNARALTLVVQPHREPNLGRADRGQHVDAEAEASHGRRVHPLGPGLHPGSEGDRSAVDFAKAKVNVGLGAQHRLITGGREVRDPLDSPFHGPVQDRQGLAELRLDECGAGAQLRLAPAGRTADEDAPPHVEARVGGEAHGRGYRDAVVRQAAQRPRDAASLDVLVAYAQFNWEVELRGLAQRHAEAHLPLGIARGRGIGCRASVALQLRPVEGVIAGADGARLHQLDCGRGGERGLLLDVDTGHGRELDLRRPARHLDEHVVGPVLGVFTQAVARYCLPRQAAVSARTAQDELPRAGGNWQVQGIATLSLCGLGDRRLRRAREGDGADHHGKGRDDQGANALQHGQ